MKGWKAIAWTLCLVFLVGMLVQFAATVTDIWKTDLSTLQQVANAGVMAVVAFLINWAAPWVDRYGIGSKPRHVNAAETLPDDSLSVVPRARVQKKKDPTKRE